MVRTAEAARARVLAEQIGRSGNAPLYRQIVDGQEGAALEAVRPDGVIVFAWSYIREVAADTFDMLRRRSPRDSGEFIRGILILVDGQQADASAITLETRQITIVASAPYSRRLEVGKHRSGGPFVVSVAPHFIEETAIVAARLFGDLAKITFGYVDLSNAYSPRHASEHRKRAEAAIQYPAITITPRVA
jgi:hypothetical protein